MDDFSATSMKEADKYNLKKMKRLKGDEVEIFGDHGNGTSYDAIVIGSGYGGSVAACRLSMAGVKVCLVEKGRKWEAQDFPTDSFKISSAVRMENKNLGVSFGPKDALFQIHEQDDSIAMVACGLGGGSLVNAGVMQSTPVRARRDPKWPKEWEKDWKVCEASASNMLSSQNIPIEFSNVKVMREVAQEEIEESHPDSMRLSMNFGTEETPHSLNGSCLACGNCLSGCPYNAKNSTDKNYLASAVQAGCVVRTESQVQLVLRNPHENCQHDGSSRKQNRRWRVYFNDIDYVASDFVVISAGVFGTSKILFESERRGLRVSERLGFGFSCNGNNVAYLDGSSAPLNAYGLERKQFSKIPFKDRPGPSISSSYTSSLGFTIQSAVIPVAYPSFLFKGIVTYGWPIGFWFLHGLINKLKLMMDLKATEAMIFNLMGYDKSDGRITLENDTGKLCFKPPYDPLLTRKVQALQKLTKRLGGILFMSRYRSTSVHLLGGCNVASDHTSGVCNPDGQVFDPKSSMAVHPGLYVCDASLIPCSTGINPCLTIATAAEFVSRNLVQEVLKYKNTTQTAQFPDVKLRSCNDDISTELIHQDLMPRSTVVIKEIMRGHLEGMPCTAYLTIKMNSADLKGSNEQNSNVGDHHSLLKGKVGGYVECKAVEKDKLYIIDGEVDMSRVDNKSPFTQYMHYHLILASKSSSRYVFEGMKIMNPYLLAFYGWRESRTLHVTLKTDNHDVLMEEMVDLKGELHLSVIDLVRSLMTLEGNKRGRFICLLLQSFFRTYISQIPRGRNIEFSLPELKHKPYPASNLHEIKTGDGYIISCRQWKCNPNPCKREEEETEQNIVLLINGYATESFWLPTEQNDLVRTLLEHGHETWLLQARVHPSHPSMDFTIEDIGRFDIPAVITKIHELHGSTLKVHVVAHCVGGLAIHIALMGGYISATNIASLCCTNSSMFFKLTKSSLVKMWLPLIPMSMKILGKNKILQMFQSSKSSPRHRLLKSIARFIPRCERCTLDECEVFSGIFGNSFWHNNVSSTLHYWLSKQSLPTLPMSGFPHIRKICNAGFIVDSKGKNSYLIHPERMTLPTTYISGGRSLLVTPKTSFLANQYMKLHQPGYRHQRIVVEGFGHSDILIGEESCTRVFPHILSHIELSEKERNNDVNESMYRKEALSWGDDPFDEGNGRFGSWVSPLILFWSFILLLFLVSLF